MVTFRKSPLLLLAMTAMMAAGMMAAVANAQVGPPPAFQCVANAGVPPLVRSEGLAELVGDIVLNCTGGTPTANGVQVPKVNFRVFLNTTVTSRLLDSPWNEALLMIDEPDPANQRLCQMDDGCTLWGVGAEPGVDYINGDFNNDEPPNVWQGRAVFGNTPGAGNTIEWLGVPVDPPGTQAVRIIRITNIRANAAEKGVGGGLIPSQLIAFISATGTTSIPINNPQQIVAFVQDGLDFSGGFASFLQCEDPDNPTSGSNPIGVTFSERFATAFLVRNQATTSATPNATPQDQNVPGAIYNTETGFYSGFSGWTIVGSQTHNADPAGLASQGTRLVAHFSNIPAGVDLYVSGTNNLFAAGHAACIVPGADSNGWGGTPDCAAGETQVVLSGGAGTATWEVVDANPVAVEDFGFSVRVDYTANTQAGIPALGTGSVGGSYGPISDLTAATSADIQPRFIDDSTAEDLLTINSCATNLLWPFVTNQAGFDTGLVISNTSMDPFGTATQEGPCEIYYFGNSNGGDPPAMDTTPTISGGGYAIWTLSSGGGVKQWGQGLTGSIAAAPGFEGYVIAHCLFQYAHGYGFISDLGASRLSQGYLALILDQPIWGGGNGGSRTNSKSEPLNQ